MSRGVKKRYLWLPILRSHSTSNSSGTSSGWDSEKALTSTSVMLCWYVIERNACWSAHEMRRKLWALWKSTESTVDVAINHTRPREWGALEQRGIDNALTAEEENVLSPVLSSPGDNVSNIDTLVAWKRILYEVYTHQSSWQSSLRIIYWNLSQQASIYS